MVHGRSYRPFAHPLSYICRDATGLLFDIAHMGRNKSCSLSPQQWGSRGLAMLAARNYPALNQIVADYYHVEIVEFDDPENHQPRRGGGNRLEGPVNWVPRARGPLGPVPRFSFSTLSSILWAVISYLHFLLCVFPQLRKIMRVWNGCRGILMIGLFQ